MKKPNGNYILQWYETSGKWPQDLSGALGIIGWYLWSEQGMPIEVFKEMCDEEPRKYLTIAQNMALEAGAYIHEKGKNNAQT